MFAKKVVRRGKPRWVLDIRYVDEASGRHVRVRRDAKVQTKTGAEDELHRLRTEVKTHGHLLQSGESPARPEREPFTFAAGVSLFLETKAITRLKATTRRGYVHRFDTLLLPAWGGREIETIGFVDFSRLDASLTSRGLKPATRANILCAARSVLRHCVSLGILPEMPRLPTQPKPGDTICKPPPREVVLQLLEHAPPNLRLSLRLATDAGLRAGEIRGVQWRDIDLTRRTMIVRRTVYHGVPDTPKSGHERIIPLTHALWEALTNVTERPPGGPVAVSRRGTAWSEPGLIHAFVALRDSLGVGKFRLHDLRHFFVTELFKRGAGAPTVRDLAGHRHMHVTARYAHSDEGARRAAIEALDLPPRLA